MLRAAFAIHIEDEALAIKLGPFLIVTYPYLGLIALALYNPNRGLKELRHVVLQLEPLENRQRHY